jgi:LacI family transcriptional regulator
LYRERYAGFEKSMTQNNVPIIEGLIFYQELSVDNARKAMHRLFSEKPYPDGIFGTNDSTALTALEFAKEKGIVVPSQLKIVGYSNDPRGSIVSPSITTVEQFPGRIAKAIVDELLKILTKEVDAQNLSSTPIVIPVQLVRRMST